MLLEISQIGITDQCLFPFFRNPYEGISYRCPSVCCLPPPSLLTQSLSWSSKHPLISINNISHLAKQCQVSAGKFLQTSSDALQARSDVLRLNTHLLSYTPTSLVPHACTTFQKLLPQSSSVQQQNALSATNRTAMPVSES